MILESLVYIGNRDRGATSW